MRSIEKMAVVVLVLAGSAAFVQVVISFQERGSKSISGIVEDDKGPVAGAIVRVQATANCTTTSADGSFVLADLSRQAKQTITA